MGEAEINNTTRQIIIRSVLFFYGNAANDEISFQVAKDIETHWNEATGKTRVKNILYEVVFEIQGQYASLLTPQMIYENTHPQNNYFRIE